ncbi:MAG TPA: NmrA family NAD(P)-binding protein [Candidatus Eremiobacteraceae bacterium]|nr:NmrA family NAD(P)-binding protein [Candidatus Eremiobacteraceae bacterium]
MYTVLGATGHIGSVIARVLLEKGEKVRVVGRSTARLQPLVQKGAEPFIADVKDAAALARAFTGVRAAFLMMPPGLTSQDYQADQEKESDAISIAAKNSGLHYAVNLSSIGAQAPSGNGPIAGLHRAEKKLNAVDKLNVLHLRPAYFFENHLSGINMIQMMGVYGGAIRGDLQMAMIASRDIGEYAAQRLLNLDFTGKQTQELLGERDLSMNEVTAIIGKALNKPDLRYAQFPYDQVQQVLMQMGVPSKTAAYFIEMFRGFNEGIVVATEPRSQENTTPTSFEAFVKEVFVPAYQSMAVGA